MSLLDFSPRIPLGTFSILPSTLMDDIIVWGTTLEEHNERLKMVFEATKKANLKLNYDKCEFGVQELTFVGDVISSEGVKPDPIKVRAIQNFTTPTSKKDVQRFLGMVNYQGRYIPDLSNKSTVLRQHSTTKMSSFGASRKRDVSENLRMF